MNRGVCEFWQMIIDQNVKYITALNEEFTTDYRAKNEVFCYFPDEDEKQMQVMNKYQITNVLDELIVRKNYTQRMFVITDLENGETVHSVTHIHFHEWEDSEEPEDGTMEDLMSIFQT